MAQRYTVKDASNCFTRLTKAEGKRFAKDYKDIGGWSLDCNSVYGGCEIRRIANKSGGVHVVTNRLPPAAFCQAVSFHEAIQRKFSDGFDGLNGTRSKKHKPKRRR